MEREPREESDYGSRRVEAARRVLVDLGQVLASFGEAIVVVGGWVPDLLRTQPGGSPHIGSIDVDLALDVEKLGGGRYAELVKLLLDTGRYERGDKDFQLMIQVDLRNSSPTFTPPETPASALCMRGAPTSSCRNCCGSSERLPPSGVAKRLKEA